MTKKGVQRHGKWASSIAWTNPRIAPIWLPGLAKDKDDGSVRRIWHETNVCFPSIPLIINTIHYCSSLSPSELTVLYSSRGREQNFPALTCNLEQMIAQLAIVQPLVQPIIHRPPCTVVVRGKPGRALASCTVQESVRPHWYAVHALHTLVHPTSQTAPCPPRWWWLDSALALLPSSQSLINRPDVLINRGVSISSPNVP